MPKIIKSIALVIANCADVFTPFIEKYTFRNPKMGICAPLAAFNFGTSLASSVFNSAFFNSRLGKTDWLHPVSSRQGTFLPFKYTVIYVAGSLDAEFVALHSH